MMENLLWREKQNDRARPSRANTVTHASNCIPPDSLTEHSQKQSIRPTCAAPLPNPCPHCQSFSGVPARAPRERVRSPADLSAVGGEGGIRTPETLARLTVFKTAAFDHSATSPSSFTRNLRAYTNPPTERGQGMHAGGHSTDFVERVIAGKHSAVTQILIATVLNSVETRNSLCD